MSPWLAFFIALSLAIALPVLIAVIQYQLSCKHLFVPLDNDSTLDMWQCIKCAKTTYDIEEVWLYNEGD